MMTMMIMKKKKEPKNCLLCVYIRVCVCVYAYLDEGYRRALIGKLADITLYHMNLLNGSTPKPNDSKESDRVKGGGCYAR